MIVMKETTLNCQQNMHSVFGELDITVISCHASYFRNKVYWFVQYLTYICNFLCLSIL